MSANARFSQWAAVFLALALAWPRAEAAAANPRPEISLSLRGVANRTIQAGEPLFIAVRIETAAEDGAAIELAPASGTWADAVEVGLSGAKSGAPSIRAKLTVAPDNAVATLSGEQAISAVWMVGGSATSPLPPGDYQVQVRLLLREGRGWKGEATSEAMPLRIVAATSEPERAVQLVLARAHEAALAGLLQDAAHMIDALLAAHPDDIRLLSSRAALCLRGGDYRSAQVCVNRAWRSFERENARHPPVGLFELENQVASALMSAGEASSNPPDWTRLPAAVLAESPGDRVSPKTTKPTVAASVSPVAPVAPTAPVAPVSEPKATNPQPSVPPAARELVGAVVPSSELVDAAVATDPAGQWAASATASSQYGAPRYGPVQATGAPNIPLGMAGDNPDAWCPASKNDGTAWLELTYARPVHATEVRVRQNDTAGAIAKVEAIEPDGTAHVWWEGVDPHQPPAIRQIAWFAVRVPKTSYLVARIKLTLNLAARPGWKQIDAVQLVAPQSDK